jgi:hypothetical protein
MRRTALKLGPSPSLQHAFSGEDDISCGQQVFKCDCCSLPKRASRFSPSMVKHVGRNKLMVCRRCDHQPCQGENCERMLAPEDVVGAHPQRCADCKPIPCKACAKEYPARTWSTKAQDNYRNQNSALICPACESRGFTSRDWHSYTCQLCTHAQSRHRFDPVQVRHYKERGGRLRCLDCLKTHGECGVCKHWKQAGEQKWTVDQMKKNRKAKQQSTLVCLTCAENGYTAKDMYAYTCAGCSGQGGRWKFDAQDIKHTKSRGDILFCGPCKERERRLLALLNSEKGWRCTCGNKRAQRRCLASCRLYPERCRGCNVGVRPEDIVFMQKKGARFKVLY